MAYSDSATATTTLNLTGVWVVDPDVGGDVSARHYPYGTAQREEELDPMGAESFFSGRRDPVVDYGEHERYAVPMTLDIPHGPTWREDVEGLRGWGRAKKVLHVRDNRGRALYCNLSSVRIRDQRWGSQASFTATRVNYPQEVIVP